MLTARDSIADRVHGLDTGADDYLTKPFDLNELLARLRALIRRSAGDPSPLLRIQDLEINTAAKCVSLSGQLISLTSREYALLEYLAHHHGQVVSRTISGLANGLSRFPQMAETQYMGEDQWPSSSQSKKECEQEMSANSRHSR